MYKTLALVVGALALAKGAETAAPKNEPEVEAANNKPSFEPLDWFDPNRLDARPLIWSLQNRPNEWKEEDNIRVSHDTWRNGIKHVPSEHYFITEGFGLAYMTANYCDCTRGPRTYFQRGQSRALKRAVRDWRQRKIDAAAAAERAKYPARARQFASHFFNNV